MRLLPKSLIKVGHSLSDAFDRLFRLVFLTLIGAYRTIGTTHLGGQCRFEPSCSEYAVVAFQIWPGKIALTLVLKRILRCRPGGPSGFDPVPENRQRN